MKNGFVKGAVVAAVILLIYLSQTDALSVLTKPAAAPSPEIHNAEIVASTEYVKDAKPILDKRCVVCHACYDAPCQLKLGSIEGITRGANKSSVYDGERLVADNLSRLFEDAHSTQAWREKDFFPVLNEKQSSRKANIDNSVLAQMLLQKQAQPLPNEKLLADSFDLDLNREQQCATLEEYSDYRKEHPLWGMPYGLPAISQDESNVLTRWIEEGSAYKNEASIPENILEQINDWEKFFNQDSLKAQLTSRYIFEHMFLSHLYFESDYDILFFKLVRSATPPGQALEQIATRRPFDDPGVKRVYYRFKPLKETISDKLHLPYLLNKKRMQRFTTLFLEPDYKVDKLPSYQAEFASNPFITFAQLPTIARYRFMLEEAQNTIMQFIKGPVCRGQIALNVINDYFWVAFVDPELDYANNDATFIQQALKNIQLPAEAKSNSLPINWLKYAKMEKEYLKAKSAYIKQNIQDKVSINLDLLWDGDGNNENATLTIFRHFDAATVAKGLLGTQPQTAWVLTYPLFERIHYLLVAGYDVYGNAGHQLNSRMYMDFLRMEGEFNFLAFLPLKNREQVRKHWYRGSVSEVEKFVFAGNTFDPISDINYQTEQPLTELYALLKTHFAGVLPHRHKPTEGFSSQADLRAIEALNKLSGKPVSLLGQATFVAVTDDKEQRTEFYSMLRHNAYTNISHLFSEGKRRIPDEDRLSFLPDFLSSHPNAFMQVNRDELGEFSSLIAAMKTPKDYERLMDRFGVRRTDKNFWAFSDHLHTYYQQHYPVEFGLFDFNRLENR